MTTVRLSAAAMLLTATLVALPASAQQTGPYDAEVDCNGDWNGGDIVPWAIRFENNTFEGQPIDVTVMLTVPRIGQLTLINTSFTLGPNQDVTIPRSLRLPGQAPAGQWGFQIMATSGGFTAFDTCSFDVF